MRFCRLMCMLFGCALSNSLSKICYKHKCLLFNITFKCCYIRLTFKLFLLRLFKTKLVVKFSNAKSIAKNICFEKCLFHD